ncbi:hypothetical protein HDU67_008761 [Dinochytrium kinnereticum]|nr:hypothetical protein HDU67_008761 [Dinochytrium kinnereticum]
MKFKFRGLKHSKNCREKSDFVFTQRLIDSFCGKNLPTYLRESRIPDVGYLSVRFSTLTGIYSLASKFDSQLTKRQNINLLIGSDDITPLLSRVLRKAAGLKRYSEWSTNDNLINYKRAIKSDLPCMQGSCLTEAKDGTILMDLDRMNKKACEKLAHVMSRTVIQVISEPAPISFSPSFSVWGYTTLSNTGLEKLREPEMASTLVNSHKGYFATMRQTIGSIAIGQDSMFSTLELCLRDTALVEDALISIMLVEESIAFAYGVSCLGFTTLPEDQENVVKLYSSPSEMMDFMTMEEKTDPIDEVMNRYRLWFILVFIKKRLVTVSRFDRFYEHVLRSVERHAETALAVKRQQQDDEEMYGGGYAASQSSLFS